MIILNYEQGTQEWLDARIGVITGTRLKQVLGTQSKSLLYELIAEQLAPAKEIVVNDAMERGSQLEEDARMLYTGTTGYDVEEVGLCLHEDHDWLGSSPDGIILDEKKERYVGAIEIKCPDTKTHIKYLVEDKIPTEYKAQVLQYFLVNTDLEWLDFVSYDPRIQLENMQIFIKRVMREDLQDELEVAMAKLLKFRDQWEKLQEQYIF